MDNSVRYRRALVGDSGAARNVNQRGVIYRSLRPSPDPLQTALKAAFAISAPRPRPAPVMNHTFLLIMMSLFYSIDADDQ
jgi:hypothetical protein